MAVIRSSEIPSPRVARRGAFLGLGSPFEEGGP
jgi:hypothetical protein